MDKGRSIISVLLPSRGRPLSLARTVTGLRQLADAPNGLEILVAADPDDQATIETAQQLRVHCWTAPERYGYHQMHRYFNQLASLATGTWLLLWNDDAVMTTAHWDSLILAQDPSGVLWPRHNDSPVCNIFPVWPRAWTDAMGHVSLSPHCDSWIQLTGEAVGRQWSIPVYVIHDTPPLGGGHDDQTRAESQAGYRSDEFHYDHMIEARARDAAAVRRLLL